MAKQQVATTKRKRQGVGVPTDQSDFLIPMARVLQNTSPEVEKKGTNYIKGAEPGDIYIKNAPSPIIKADVGFDFQPCYINKSYVEWVPRNKGGGGGGGFVTAHPSEPEDTISRQDPQNVERTIRVRRSNNNLIVETRYYGGYMLANGHAPMPLVIPFASSGHAVAKAWNMMIASKMIDGEVCDLYEVAYHLNTRLRTRHDQSWYVFDVTDAGPEKGGLPTTQLLSDEYVERGAALHKSLAADQRRIDAPAAAAEEEAPF